MNRPLSEHAINCLRSIGANPQPRQNFNPGVIGKLSAEELIEPYMALSPFREGGRRGIRIQWVRASVTGTALLAAMSREKPLWIEGNES